MSSCETSPCLKEGTVLNAKWEIVEHIATGGKGEVYRARQTNLDRDVVVKTISRGYLADLEGDDEYIQTELQRFHREALAMASIRHPYIVQVYDQDEAMVIEDGVEHSVQYLVMEYVDGPSLRSTMPQEGFCSDEQQAKDWIRAYFLRILDGVQAVHDLGIVHRDIKPENVLLENGTPKIMDFGLAGGIRWSGLTKSHHVEGTITYMAPEQFMDLGETDARGDVYALGKILYEAAIGKMNKKTAFPLKGVSLPSAGTPFLKGLDRIIREATAEEAEERIPSVKELKERLEQLLADFDESRLHILGLTLPRPGTKLVVVVMALVIGVIIASNWAHHAIMVRQAGEHGEGPEGASTIVSRARDSEPASKQGEGTFPASQVIEEDGVTLRIVPGGELTVPGLGGAAGASPARVFPLYMAETEVTNGQYVRFLNRVLSRISVADEAVKSGGSVWLILGEPFGGYEPIVFRDGRFSVKDPRYDALPVTRVTAQGAQAYARFYGARLPTEIEWYRAALSDKRARSEAPDRAKDIPETHSELEREMIGLVEAYGVLDKVGADASGYSARPSRIPYTVSEFAPNDYGIRGLSANIGEWGIRSGTEREGHATAPKFVILGGMDETWLLGSTLIRGPEQNPNEALAWVGFRIVKDANPPGGGE
ncbi:MAG: bifunctional serine/threonine-protein kinase/formylglycine-generating enzyme family protein [Thermodesulfobacteriota bacterium]